MVEDLAFLCWDLVSFLNKLVSNGIWASYRSSLPFLHNRVLTQLLSIPRSKWPTIFHFNTVKPSKRHKYPITSKHFFQATAIHFWRIIKMSQPIQVKQQANPCKSQKSKTQELNRATAPCNHWSIMSISRSIKIKQVLVDMVKISYYCQTTVQ